MTSLRSDIEAALSPILALSEPRILIAVAGPPGGGKSTFAADLCAALDDAGRPSAVVPMDGFHLDNRLLEAKGLLVRKGAPQTFDGDGFLHLVERIAAGEHVHYPLFDRDKDASIAGAAELTPDVSHVIFEGNYLLCDVDPWDRLLSRWSFSIRIDPGVEIVAQRLLSRWIDQGMPEAAARKRRDENDMPNAHFIAQNSVAPDLILGP